MSSHLKTGTRGSPRSPWGWDDMFAQLFTALKWYHMWVPPRLIETWGSTHLLLLAHLGTVPCWVKYAVWRHH